jgi:sporulation protein YlmC with PRC-barrel domain
VAHRGAQDRGATNPSIEESEMTQLIPETGAAAAERSGVEPARRTGPGPALMGAATLIGDDVCDKEGEFLGVLKEVMLDMRTGRIAYAVLSSGGLLSLGTKLFALPWRALRLDTSNRCLVLDVKKESLADAPGFDPDRWPDLEDPTWANLIHSYYGTKPYYDRAR